MEFTKEENMKIGVKKIIVYMIMCFVIIMAMTPKVQAAGLVIAFSKSTANVGDTITIKVTGNEVKGNVKLTVSGNATLKEDTVSLDNGPASVDLDVNGTGSIRVVATSVDDMQDSATGTPYSTGGTITVEGTSDSDSSNDTTTEQESSNANLSNLGIRPNDFSGFKPGTTTYNVTVPEDVESVEVYATAQDSAATVSGTGSQTLAYGENTLSVVVTAEDGTTKTYTINVTREGEEETGETEGETEIINGLSNITIGDLELSPAFKKDVYEYTVQYTVEILGNEDLKEGENIITILVADGEGNNVATYQLTVNKSLVDEEALAKEEEERQQQEQRKMFMIAGGIIALILIIVIIIVIKRRRNRAYAEEFSGVPFAGINDEDEYDNDYDNYDDDNQFDNYNAEPLNGQNEFSQKEDNDDLQTEENNQEMSIKLDFDDSKEKEEKEKAKRDFLEGYNSDYTDEYEEDRPRRGRRKGKRFK